MDELESDRSTQAPPNDGSFDDEDYLDELYERALSCFEGGGAFDPAPWLAERAHLEQAIESAVQLAREVAASAGARPSRGPPRVAGYLLERELGHGAMGAVYLARQEALGGRPVALKVLAAPAAFSPRARQRFLREARALAKVRHAHVVPVHDVIESGEVCAYSMEWIEGASLERVLRRVREAPAGERLSAAAEILGARSSLSAESWPLFVVRMGRDLARALAAVHDAGLLHRDVKPANVLLRSDGTVLLTDFSLVRDPEDELVTRTGQFVGTPAYAAPEQLRAEGRAVDARSDLYGLGATLFEALTLHRPQEGRTPAELLARIESGAPAHLRKHDPRLSRDLETIVAKCLEPEPVRRYASAVELAEDLERLLRLEPIRARRAGWIERALKSLRRERKRWIAGLIGAALVFAPALWVSERLSAWLRRDQLARELRRQAQLSLLIPTVDNALWAAAFEPRLGIRPWPPIDDFRDRGTRSVALYTQALALDAEPALARELATEREVVELARDLIEGRPISPSASLTAEHPLTARCALDLAGMGNGARTHEEVAATTREDRRTLGLLAILLEQADLAVCAWQDVSLGYPIDPLADGALGQMYLARGEWELAYPRLLSAYTAFPEAGFLCSRLAEASLRTGKLEQTEQLLDRAATLELHDTFESLLRVRAGLLAEQGKAEEARALYEGLIHRRQGLSPFLDYARFLEDRGEFDLALEVRFGLAARRRDSVVAQAQFLLAAKQWWANDPAPPWRRLERMLASRNPPFGSLDTGFAELLGIEALCAGMDPGEIPDCALPGGRPSSSELECVSLLELARRMENSALKPDDIARLPFPIRSMLAWAICEVPSVARLGATTIALLGLASHTPSALPQVHSELKISSTSGGFLGVLDDGDAFGADVSPLGDLDGDGVYDLAVGAYLDDDGGTNRGAVWILFLNPDGSVNSHQKISDTEGGFSGVLDDNDVFGGAVASLGDLDGDGTSDLAVGAHLDDDGGSDRGAVWILFLNANGTVKSHQKISSTEGGFLGALDNTDLFGVAVRSLGDLDGDGLQEIGVGAERDDDGGTDTGAVWILSLNTDGTVNCLRKISATQGGFPPGQLDPDDRFGRKLDSIGDLNGDGIPDLAVGAHRDDDGGLDRGAVWVLFLNSHGAVISHQKISSTVGGFPGPLDNQDFFGWPAGISDVDGDGVPDLAVGAPGDDDGAFDAGAVWFLRLNSNGTVKNRAKVSATSGGFGGVLDAGGSFGQALCSLGDLDGDGLSDLAVAAPAADDGGLNRGAVWICFSDCQIEATVTPRNAGLNPMSYTATPAILGSTVTATVDLTTTGHPFARLLRSDFPVQRTLSSGYVVLVGGPRIAMVTGFPGPLSTGVPGPLATFQISIPNVTALCGHRFYTQAVHFGGGLPFALSNSQDFVIGH